MTMTKKQARAIVSMCKRIEAAVDACLPQLSHEQAEYAQSYWAARIKRSIRGYDYGGVPRNLALNVLEESE